MKAVHILLVEDNEGDVLLTTEALEEANFADLLSVVKDGQQAMDFLCKRGIYSGSELPDLILLDINLPKKNGHEVLAFIKTHQLLAHIPVVMLSTSLSDSDTGLAYRNSADGYITKPIDPELLRNALSDVQHSYISTANHPLSSNH